MIKLKIKLIKTMERRIGDIFNHDGVTLEVVEEIDGCDYCYLKEYGCCDSNWTCTGRSDGKSVIFKKVDKSLELLIKAHEELVRCGIESEIVDEIEEYLNKTK